jgi:hypothetical protein
MGKINRLNIAEHLVDVQLKMVNRTMFEAMQNPDWFHEWTMTTEQHEKLKAYAIPLLKKVFKFNTNKAKSTFDFFILQYGLKIKD